MMFLGSVNGIALGLLISCIGRSPAEASNAATTIGTVLQFFTGMHFPLEYLPAYLEQVDKIIPMTYADQSVKDVMLRNAVLADVLQHLLTLAVSAIIVYVVGVILYRRCVEKE
jgi:ABC-2 type transport system permease protein